MSQENVETVQRAVEAWNADDLDAFLAELDADVEWHPAIEPGLEGKATAYRGHAGARKIWRQDRGDAWKRLTNRPQEFRDLGESVLALGHIDLTARVTGIEFSQEVGEVFDLRAGKIVRIRDFLTHGEAIEAAGLSESAMSQENVETAHRFTEALNRGDYGAAAAELDPGLEIDDTDIPESTGADSFYVWLARWDAAWESWRIEDLEVRPVGKDRTISLFKMIVRGKGSGIELTRDDAVLTEFRNGKIARIGYYNEQAQALNAAGLSE